MFIIGSEERFEVQRYCKEKLKQFNVDFYNVIDLNGKNYLKYIWELS